MEILVTREFSVKFVNDVDGASLSYIYGGQREAV